MYMMPYNANLFDDVMSPFENFFKGMDFRPGLKNFMTTDVIELKDGLKLIMDLPGLKKENIKIKLENGYLNVSAASKKESEEKDEKRNYLRKERYSGQYTRSFYVGKSVKPEDIKARFEDGSLILNFPKDKEKLPESEQVISIEG